MPYLGNEITKKKKLAFGVIIQKLSFFFLVRLIRSSFFLLSSCRFRKRRIISVGAHNYVNTLIAPNKAKPLWAACKIRHALFLFGFRLKSKIEKKGDNWIPFVGSTTLVKIRNECAN